jgi:ribosomal protein L12E/L44/L45/RPP1/RPP2
MVADNVILEIRLFNHVCVSDVVGAEFDQSDGRVNIHLGGLYAGEEREVTVELTVPPGKGSQTLASGEIKGTTGSDERFLAAVQYTDDVKEVEQKRDLDTQAKADVAVSTRRVEQALNALDQGDKDEAAKEIEAASGALMASPAASQAGAAGEMVKEQLGRLRGYQQTITNESEDKGRAKKAIQSDNYNTQKKNQ